jgi:hypothetical protein
VLEGLTHIYGFQDYGKVARGSVFLLTLAESHLEPPCGAARGTEWIPEMTLSWDPLVWNIFTKPWGMKISQ